MGLDVAEVFTATGDPKALLRPDVSMGELTTSEPHGHLHLVAVFEKTTHVANLDVDVVIVGLRAELDLFDLDLDLVLSSGRSPFLSVVFELPIVLDPTDGRPAIWRHLDQIEAARLREADRILDHEFTKLVALFVDDKHARHTNSSIDAWLVLVGLGLHTTTW